jgi:hypothetical protein
VFEIRKTESSDGLDESESSLDDGLSDSLIKAGKAPVHGTPFFRLFMDCGQPVYSAGTEVRITLSYRVRCPKPEKMPERRAGKDIGIRANEAQNNKR